MILNFGLTDDHKELLFNALPSVSSQKSILELTNFESVQVQRQEKSIAEESIKQKALSRILDLRNADARAIDKVNKSRIIKAFSPKPTLDEEQKLDPGCSEVQGMKIDHFQKLVCSDRIGSRSLTDLFC